MSEPPGYAELHCLSHFSFGRGASSARQLFERARQCGYRALAITDECSLAGIVRAHEAAGAGTPALVVGTEIALEDGPRLVLLAENAAGYRTLCALITRGRRRAVKGRYRLHRTDLDDALPGTLALWLPGAHPEPAEGAWLRERFGTRVWLAVELHRGPDDRARLAALEALGAGLGMARVASGDVHMHRRGQRAVQDTLVAIAHRTTVAGAGTLLFPNGERHLRSRRALAAVYPRALLEESVRIAERCDFSLSSLRYTYPRELVPDGHTPASWLRALTEQGMRRRWPEGAGAEVCARIEHELALIAELGYEPYFLTVHDIVRYARERGILCQGRGSAANSAVCFCLGITEVDPARIDLLVERFISRERDEPPDIDVDFEHERREEIIQYLYAKYGRERAALAATVICYRPRSAVRDAGKALGLEPGQLTSLGRAFGRWDGESPLAPRLRAHGLDPDAPSLRRVVVIARALIGAPRHLSQHVGGMVISDAPLHHLVPVENAAMARRTVIQWDKDDLDTLGLLKVDCLALGMLSAVRRCLELLRRHHGVDLTPATIPAEDPQTYAMIRRADTIGVFQIESRAQQAMLPRLGPETFYDLVIQVAIVRPGPIQGRMVHPYLRRRQGLEAVDYPSGELRRVFERTLGVPLFQEQVMRLAIVAAGFTPGEADRLRRSMAAWKRRGGLEYFRERIIEGMCGRGYERDFAAQVFEQIRGFGSYGFPESHAASFALITYVSCWLKCHYPGAFVCALLNAQPLGFYGVSQLVQDARRHGVAVRPVDVRCSAWDCTLEAWPGAPARVPALRLGLRQVRGLDRAAAERLVEARADAPFRDVGDLCARAALDARARRLLAGAGALRGLAGHRHRARWAVHAVREPLPLFRATGAAPETPVTLPVPAPAEEVLADYASTGLTLGPHPLALLRRRLAARRCLDSRALHALAGGSPLRLAGLVTLRQRPASASGVIFVTVEDEHGLVNVVVWRRVAERDERALLEARLLAVDGRIESADGVIHLIAARLHDWNALLGELRAASRDFR